MKETNLWLKAKTINIQKTVDIEPGFNFAFDKRIPKDTQDELRAFIKWVENNFYIPITLWVDFEYNHYLLRRDGKRVGYLFYWADFSSYPIFNNKDDIPQIRLPVRTEHSTIDEILCSFIEAITDYYAWICNEIHDGYVADADDVEEILQMYLHAQR